MQFCRLHYIEVFVSLDEIGALFRVAEYSTDMPVLKKLHLLACGNNVEINMCTVCCYYAVVQIIEEVEK